MDAALVDARGLVGPDQQGRDAGRTADRGDASADGIEQLARQRAPVDRDSWQGSVLRSVAWAAPAAPPA